MKKCWKRRLRRNRRGPKNVNNIVRQNQQADKAERYLAKVTPSSQRKLAKAIFLMLDERWTGAEMAEAVTANLKIVKRMQ